MVDSVQPRIDSMKLARKLEISREKTGASPQVFYDAQAFLSRNGGTGKGIYLRNFIAPYAEEFVGLATKGFSYFDYHLVQGGFSRYHLWHQLFLPYLLRKWRPAFFLAPYNTAPLLIPKQTRLILILHDLILLNRSNVPNLAQRVDNEFRRLLIPRAVSRAHVVVTVSSYVKRQIEERFPSARIQVIPNMIAESWFVGDQCRTLTQRENYILTVTSDVPHKNNERAFEAYARFAHGTDPSSTPSLRVVGLGNSPAAYSRMAENLGIRDRIQFEPLLSESKLQNLYRSAKAVLVPSLSEGFGITVLEGMASGTPVLASGAASLPEVAGLAAEYFNPADVNSMAAALTEVLGSENRQRMMIREGLIQANRFHPDRVGRQIRSFWDELLGR
ncbi:MAG TPA: glycosyltransferase family 1 protein [Bryobacteraceae bacterium]|jgi:glycosyltransferase involved in cell wall biosynthesis|nr:glycosyltransferase family 1 protein [Bryobacteraceae bacterium]